MSVRASRFASAAWLAALLITAVPAPPAAAPARGGEPDFAGYQALLDEYLVVTSAKGAPLETRFDYSRLHDTPGRYERLKRIYSTLALVDPDTLDPANRRAWAINTYNFLVIRITTNELVIPNARSNERVRWPSVRDIRSDQGPFFERPAILLGDSTYSREAFERKFLLDGFDRSSDTPPATLDPRIHFALVRGASGGPPLQPKAFRGRTLDRQLDEAVRATLASPRHLAIEDGVLRGSEMFSWWHRDFGGTARAFAKQNNQREFVFFVPWDWALNHVPNS